MSDRGSGEQYDWLYGSSSKARRTAPVQERGSDLPPPQLPPPGRRAGDGRPPKQPRKGRRWRRVVLVLVVLWIAFLVAVPVWAWGKIEKVDADPGGDRPGDQPGTTYLLVGSDSRRGLTQEQRNELTTGQDGGGRGRTDTIMLMHVGSGPTTLVSIPRDSLVPVPGYGTTKINAAYAYGGPKLLVQTLEQTTGVRIDAYVEVGFAGLVNVVDSVGGIEICPKEDIKDKDSGLDVKKGCQQADGRTALAYSRNRHSYANQDIGRVQAQREVLGGIASEVKSPWTFVNPWRYFRTAGGAAGSLAIGDDVGPITLGRFAWSLSGAMSGSGLNCTVPLADFAVHWDRERALKFFDYIKKDQTGSIGDLCTKDGLPKGS